MFYLDFLALDSSAKQLRPEKTEISGKSRSKSLWSMSQSILGDTVDCFENIVTRMRVLGLTDPSCHFSFIFHSFITI